MEEAGGIPWVLIGLGVIVLGAVLAYGLMRSRKITAGEKAAQQRAAHENFRVDEDSA